MPDPIIEPTKLRELPDAVLPRPDDIFPVSQYDPDLNMSTTRGMRRDMFLEQVVEEVAEARQELVDGFTAQNATLSAAVADLQSQQEWSADAIEQIEAMDTTLQAAIATLEGKVDHPVQWSEIANKPSTYPPTLPIAVSYADITGKPSTFAPTLPIPQSGVTGLASDLGNKAPISHVGDTGNPHMVTKAQVGLGNVDNTSDANKPISTAVQTALDGKINGPVAVSSPTAITPAFGTAYAASVPTKPSFISFMIDTAYTVTVASTLADTVELRIGPNQAQVAAGAGGFVAGTFRASLTGIALVIGLALGQRNQLSAMLPAGWYYALRRTQGTTATITSATEQSVG